ncbi:Fe-S cluster assembly protein SufD [Candidatus Woesearchaeota archaeon]|nr:Fe-S cluster assembly protein SufD [Candidatus Woesearchaeota archaeon]
MELKQFQSSFAEERKKEALAVFKSIPMPKEKDEDWRYTDIGKLRLESFEPFESEGKISVSGFSEYLAEKGVILTDINTALQKYPVAQQYFLKSMKIGGDKFAALNAAYFGNGFFLHVPKNIEIDEPIKLNFEVSGKSSILHNMIIAESNSKVNFIEEYTGKENANGQLNSSVTEVFANADSKINFYHINNWAKNAYSFANIVGNLDRNSNVNWISGCFGGRLNRLKIDTIFSGNGASCSNLGIFMGKEKEHVDFATNMFHNAENTTNDVLVDGILKDESSSVYRGLIKIEKQAQKTNSYLANHILKLGDKTLANSIPSLKIDANDVKASHGATVGQINEEHLFYLMARGLSRAEAEKLIVEGFFEPIIQKIPLEELREKIRGMVGG